MVRAGVVVKKALSSYWHGAPSRLSDYQAEDRRR